MSETSQIILGLCFLIAVYILTRRVHVWRIRRAYNIIIRDLQEKGAVDPPSAVELPYSEVSMFRMSLRDYRPKTLHYLISSGIIGVTDSGKYYLKDRNVGSIDSK
ncbi:MAG: hypothetical protein JSW70_01875 [Syntrophobacterales bacterium]|nr:MAG: hypothetical protein JSW70_01875 [Syntrophobacterales bacterium]